MESINYNLKQTNETDSKAICVCQSIRPTLLFCRFFGLFPAGSNHDTGNCVFQRSQFWFAWSIMALFIIITSVFWTTKLSQIGYIFQEKSLLLVLSGITDLLYGSYMVLILLLNLGRFPKYCKTLNDIIRLTNEDLLCPSALHAIKTTQWRFVIFLWTMLWLFVALLAMFYFWNYENFDLKIAINRFFQMYSFLVYVIFYYFTCLIVGLFGCFEKTTKHLLNYQETNSMQELSDATNMNYLLGIFPYEICSEKHYGPGKLLHFSQAQVIEYLRCLHEEICVVVYGLNAAMNPQFLLHISIELTILIVDWYAVIIYYIYHSEDFHENVHYLNIYFVAMHTFGLWVFLKTADRLKTMITSLEFYLLEFSTRANSFKEHQQVRLFLEKLKMHRPLTANGIFTMDLSIAGPISANILTYVLVALQFDAAKY